MKNTACLCVLIVFSLLWFGGCRKVDEEGRSNVSGRVTLDDNPIDEGNIVFAPIETQAPEGAGIIGGSTRIFNGQYKIARDLGLFPGTYSIQISSVKITDPKTGGTPDRETFIGSPESFVHTELIPEKYNTNTTLQITIGEEKNQTFDFDLKSN